MKYFKLNNPIFLVMIGAIPGAIGRYVLGLVFNVPFFAIPIGTLIANTLGSIILGMVVTMYRLQLIKPEVITSIGIGFCGSLTTMSSFAVESLKLLTGSAILFLSYLGRITVMFFIVRRSV